MDCAKSLKALAVTEMGDVPLNCYFGLNPLAHVAGAFHPTRFTRAPSCVSFSSMRS
jgi:hypothetical protein